MNMQEESFDDTTQPLQHDTFDRFSVGFPRDKRFRTVIYVVCSIFVVISIVTISLAITWRHAMGILLSLALFLFSLFGMYVVRTEIWYSRKIKYVKILSFFLYFVVAFLVILLMIVHLASVKNPPNVWPSQCGSNQNNCARLANDSSFGMPNGTLPVTLQTTRSGALSYITKWIQGNPRASVIFSTENSNNQYNSPYVHSRFVSFFFSFPDDFYVQIVCTHDQKAQFWIQSQSRLGTGDFGVNQRRILRFLSYANTTSPSVQGLCV